MADAALGAGDAGTNVVGSAFPDLVGEVRVGDEGSGHADDVQLTLLDEPFRQGRRVDPTGADDRQRDHLFQARRQVRELARFVIVGRPVRATALGARHDPLPHVEVIDAPCTFEQPGHGLVVLQTQTVVHEIVVEANAQQEIGAELAAHRFHHLEQEAHPLLEIAAAILVVAKIGRWIEKIGEQIVHSHRQLDAIH